MHAAQRRIRVERRAVDAYLAGTSTDSPRVYGFSTMLGQRDDTDASLGYQQELLDGHLLGRQTTISRSSLRAVTVAKMMQLAEGGSGVSPSTFQLVLKRWPCEEMDTNGAWLDSYGAGDVIPASWWIRSLLGDDISAADLPAGDIIALMNGNFFSTGCGIAVLDRMAATLARSLAALAAHVAPPVSSQVRDSPLYEAYMSSSHHVRGTVAEQNSVVMRDGLPFLRAAEQALTSMASAINKRLSRPSCNPFFDISESHVHAHYSQSSFLDLCMSSAVSAAADALRFHAAGIQSIVKMGDKSAAVSKMELPKLAEVFVEEMYGGMEPRFAISEAGGVEDISDRALQRISRLNGVLDAFDSLLDLYEEHFELPRGGTYDPEITGAIGNLIRSGDIAGHV